MYSISLMTVELILETLITCPHQISYPPLTILFKRAESPTNSDKIHSKPPYQESSKSLKTCPQN